MRKKKSMFFALIPGVVLLCTPIHVFASEQSMGEKMSDAVQNTVLGIGTVFIMLIIISVIIYCFRFIPKLTERFAGTREEKENAKRVGTSEKQAAADEGTDTSRTGAVLSGGESLHQTQKDAAMMPGSLDVPDMTELELVAVIAAAIAASEQIPPDGFVVRTIRKRS